MRRLEQLESGVEGVAGGGDVVAGRPEDDVATKLEEELEELEAAVQTVLGERRLQQQLRERVVECLDELLRGELAAGDEETEDGEEERRGAREPIAGLSLSPAS